jgi:hypothetical protein
MNLKQAILSADDKDLRKVPVPEWGIDVYIGAMTAGERDSWENEWLQNQGKGGVPNFRSKFLVRCLCDENGSRLFGMGDVEQLATKKASVINRLFEIAREENALTAEQVDELAKN